jgi:hypothetical protein
MGILDRTVIDGKQTAEEAIAEASDYLREIGWLPALPADGDIVRCPVKHVIHGDCYPAFNAFYCYECDYFFKGESHFLKDNHTHDATHHLHKYLRAIGSRRPPKRDTEPDRNFFAVRVFRGREPTPRVARVFAKLIWRHGPVDTYSLKEELWMDAWGINEYRAEAEKKS